MPQSSPWTDSRITTLKSLWADGFSATEIAGRLGMVSRNAVIGKVHRLGLPGRRAGPGRRTSPNRPHRPGKRTATSSRATTAGNPTYRALLRNGNAPPGSAPIEELVIPLHERRSVATLTPQCCRWPIGDPKHAGFHFCGRSRIGDLPYCEPHALRAYRPARVQHYAASAGQRLQPRAASSTFVSLEGISLTNPAPIL